MTAEIDMTLKIECQARDVEKGKWEGSKQAQHITIHSFRNLEKGLASKVLIYVMCYSLQPRFSKGIST